MFWCSLGCFGAAWDVSVRLGCGERWGWGWGLLCLEDCRVPCVFGVQTARSKGQGWVWQGRGGCAGRISCRWCFDRQVQAATVQNRCLQTGADRVSTDIMQASLTNKLTFNLLTTCSLQGDPQPRQYRGGTQYIRCQYIRQRQGRACRGSNLGRFQTSTPRAGPETSARCFSACGDPLAWHGGHHTFWADGCGVRRYRSRPRQYRQYRRDCRQYGAV